MPNLSPLARSRSQANNTGVQEAALAIIFVATIVSLYARPFGAKDWQVAAVGAAFAWVVGPFGLRGGIETAADSANILAFFLGLMLVAAGAEAAGLYARVAELLRARRTARGRVGLVLVLGVLITAILSNDATPLVLTPAIYAAGAVASRGTTDSSFAATFTADGASLLLPVSNPVNLLFYERFEMSFPYYLTTVTPAAAAGVAAVAFVTWRRVPREREAPEPPRIPFAPTRRSGPALGAVAVLACTYVVGGLAEVPLGIITLAGGVLLFVAARMGGPVDIRSYRKHVSLGILVFVASLLILVENVVEAGTLDWLTDLLLGLEDYPLAVTIVGAAAVAAVLSNLMNNWPAALLLAAIIGAATGEHEALVVGTLIGSTIGANFTIVGSLSTVFWLSLARQHGASYSAGRYARLAFAPTLAGIAAACVVAAAAL